MLDVGAASVFHGSGKICNVTEGAFGVGLGFVVDLTRDYHFMLSDMLQKADPAGEHNIHIATVGKRAHVGLQVFHNMVPGKISIMM
jgi:hypothetical protein